MSIVRIAQWFASRFQVAVSRGHRTSLPGGLDTTARTGPVVEGRWSEASEVALVQDWFLDRDDWRLMSAVDFIRRLELGPSAIDLSPLDLAILIGARLDAIGIAFEPDYRYGAKRLSQEGFALIYRFPNGGPVDASRPAFVAARAQVEAGLANPEYSVQKHFPCSEPIGVSPRVLDELATDERLRLHAYSLASDRTSWRAVHGDEVPF